MTKIAGRSKALSVAMRLAFAVWIVAFLFACSHTTLSVFFDGVPDPEEEARKAAEAAARQEAAQLAAVEAARPQIRKFAGSLHSPYERRECQACHVGRSSRLIKDPDDGLCLECHADVPDQHTNMHAVVADAWCVACHSSHSSPRPFLLKAEPIELCSECHAQGQRSEGIHHEDPTISCLECHSGHGNSDEVDPAELVGSVHKPFGDRECGFCHENKSSKLLAESADATCLECHGDVPEQHTNMHIVVAEAWCVSCHEPHSSRQPFLLKEEPVKLCGACHAPEQRSTGIHHEDPTISCLECHSGHGNSDAAEAPASVHKPYEERECGYCHEEKSSKLLAGSADATCLECHGDLPEQHTNMHIVVAEAWCVSCHEPHSASQPFLLKDKPVTLCGECHAPERRSTGIHHEDPTISCLECHSGHGNSDAPDPGRSVHRPFRERECGVCHEERSPALLGDPDDGLCTECHDDVPTQHANMHSIVADGLCSVCHAPHSSPRSSLLRFEPRKLCAECHDVEDLSDGPQHEDRSASCIECHSGHGSAGAALLK